MEDFIGLKHIGLKYSIQQIIIQNKSARKCCHLEKKDFFDVAVSTGRMNLYEFRGTENFLNTLSSKVIPTLKF